MDRSCAGGRIQLAVKRAFAPAGTSTLTTSDVFDYALARHRQDRWRRQHRWSVVRVLRQTCVASVALTLAASPGFGVYC
jgi:hypothetical protein